MVGHCNKPRQQPHKDTNKVKPRVNQLQFKDLLTKSNIRQGFHCFHVRQQQSKPCCGFRINRNLILNYRPIIFKRRIACTMK